MIIREDAGPIAVLRLQYGKVHALDLTLCASLTQELHAIAQGPSRALVITGTGSTFSGGVDLFTLLEQGTPYLRRFLPAMGSLFQEVLTFPKPAVAAINGHAIAGGCILAAACDHRLMSDGGGRIGVPELAVGVPFPPLPLEIVAARVRPDALRRVVYDAPTLLPADALAVGFLDEIVAPDALMRRALEVAERLAAIPPVSFALTKRTLVAPVLARAAAATAIAEEVARAWESDAIHRRIREYLEATVRKRRAQD